MKSIKNTQLIQKKATNQEKETNNKKEGTDVQDANWQLSVASSFFKIK